jgi:hypothetical protein
MTPSLSHMHLERVQLGAVLLGVTLTCQPASVNGAGQTRSPRGSGGLTSDTPQSSSAAFSSAPARFTGQLLSACDTTFVKMALRQAFSGLVPRLLNAPGVLCPVASSCSQLVSATAEASTSTSGGFGAFSSFLRSAWSLQRCNSRTAVIWADLATC